ncbi:MAG: glutathione synthase [Deltaproteobacteria bacterium]|nr:glutathione synthase [Deltaproteobacteria bacterium]
MILSFHPNIVADENILCAGRLPDEKDEAIIRKAEAIILPQGCSEDLYGMCRKHCLHIFPNYDVRFDFPRKLGQARLFQEIRAPFPVTYLFDSVYSFRFDYPRSSPLEFPYVFKSDWGGEGDEVFLLETNNSLERCLKRAKDMERGGRKGFLLQEYVPTGGRNLRVVVIGGRLYSYWRFQQNSSQFLTNVKAGGVIDYSFAPELQAKGRTMVEGFCSKTGINLAGFDLLFPNDEKDSSPFFLEINYFFGRRGLGGSFRYYEFVEKAVSEWLEGIGLSLTSGTD